MATRAVLGTVGKPLGLTGDVYVWADPDLGDALRPGVRCTAGDDELEVAAVRRHKGRPVVHFVGVDDRTAAERLRDRHLEVDRDLVDADDTIWADELLGREVVDVDDRLVGVVDGVLDGTAHDFLVVARPDGGEVLVPIVAELVDLADPVVVHGPPGLIDPDEAVE